MQAAYPGLKNWFSGNVGRMGSGESRKGAEHQQTNIHKLS
jgi:hypothetical protein